MDGAPVVQTEVEIGARAVGPQSARAAERDRRHPFDVRQTLGEPFHACDDTVSPADLEPRFQPFPRCSAVMSPWANRDVETGRRPQSHSQGSSPASML